MKPYFTSQSEKQEVELHQDVTISAEASGFPDVTYSWACNGEPLPDATDCSLPLRDFSSMTPQTLVCTVSRVDEVCCGPFFPAGVVPVATAAVIDTAVCCVRRRWSGP